MIEPTTVVIISVVIVVCCVVITIGTAAFAQKKVVAHKEMMLEENRKRIKAEADQKVAEDAAKLMEEALMAREQEIRVLRGIRGE